MATGKAHEKAEMAFMKKAKAPASLMKGQKAEMAKMKSGGAVKGCGMKMGGKVKMGMAGSTGYKAGGSIDGIAQRGKTKAC